MGSNFIYKDLLSKNKKKCLLSKLKKVSIASESYIAEKKNANQFHHDVRTIRA